MDRIPNLFKEALNSIAEALRPPASSPPNGQRRRYSSSSSADEEGFIIPMEEVAVVSHYATQEQANAAFVIAYCEFMRAHYQRRHLYVTDLYCSMARALDQWWMARTHLVAAVLINSGVRPCARTRHGELIAFSNQDVENCVLVMAMWFTDAQVPLEPIPNDDDNDRDGEHK